MNRVDFRTTPYLSNSSGVVAPIPFRVEATLAAPVTDVAQIGPANEKLRQGQQWASAVNSVLSSIEPHISNAVMQDEQAGDLRPNTPGSVAVCGHQYNILADFENGYQLTHVSVASKGGQPVLEFATNPNGTVTLMAEVEECTLQFKSHQGTISAKSIQPQIDSLESVYQRQRRNEAANRRYWQSLAEAQQKPDWETSTAHEHWLHNG